MTRAPYDVIVLDIWLPGMDGLATLARLQERRVDAPVVMISGHGNIESAVRAIKIGAFDFVEKPLSLEKTVLVVAQRHRQRRLEAENLALRASVDRRYDGGGELRDTPAARAGGHGRADERTRAHPRRERYRQGAGRAAITRSAGGRGPFMEVNCAAIPSELIESELFGHEKGAFTGAVADRRGQFELADGGTLFLGPARRCAS